MYSLGILGTEYIIAFLYLSNKSEAKFKTYTNGFFS